MDLLHFVLQFAFFAPIVVRTLNRRNADPSFAGELASSLRTPGLFAYEVGLLLVWTGFGIRFWTGGIDRQMTVAGLLAAAIIVAATGLLVWSVVVLRSWRLLPKIEAGHQLYTGGPYQFVRHPIYLSFDLFGLGSSIVVPSVLVIVGSALLVAGGEWRARREEKALIQVFGDQYRSYMNRVHRIIPGVY